MSKIQPFHLAIRVDDLQTARTFYRDKPELHEGRSDDHWVDFEFFGHQLAIRYKEKDASGKKSTNPVDGKAAPIPHFGMVLMWEDFYSFSEKLQQKNIFFEIEPYIRFKGKPSEQAPCFFMIHAEML